MFVNKRPTQILKSYQMRTIILLGIFLFLFQQTDAGRFYSIPADKEKKEARKLEKKTRERFLGLGIGFSHVKVMDQATSPLLYKGIEFPFLSLGYLTHSYRIVRTFEIDFSAGSLKTRTETDWQDTKNSSYYIVMRYNQLYRVRPILHDKVNWYLGPEANFNGHIRHNIKYENSAVTYDTYFGLGISNRFEFPFHIKKRKLRLSWQLSIPVVGFVIRPSYVTIPHYFDSNIFSSLSTKGGFFTPFNIRSQTELFWVLKNQNMFKLSYIWNFYNHNPGYNKVQSAFHGLCFSFIFKFNHHKKEQ